MVFNPNEKERPRKVVCAAIKLKDDPFSIICGARHFDEIMRDQILHSTIDKFLWYQAEQGFIDNYRNFLNREEACILAQKNNQINFSTHGSNKILFSEDLY